MSAPPWLSISRLSLREAVSRKLVLAGLVLSVVFLALYTLGLVLIVRNQAGQLEAVAASVLTSLGLYALFFLGAFLSLMVAAGAIASEVESGALHALLARPLSRRSYLLGRWLGLAGLLAGYVAVMGGAIILVSAVVADYEPISAMRAVALLAFAIVLLATLALWGSTRLSAIATGAITFSMFTIAWVAGFIEAIGRLIDNTVMANVGIAVSLAVPTDVLWRSASYYSQSSVALAALGGQGVPLFGSTRPAPAMLAWSAAYLLACLLLAVRSFDRRDL